MKNNCLMVQGCTSDAGKTIVVAGLCRLLRNKRFKPAPFKPQNMALNSAVTQDGGEIGRAQALQAIACGIDAHVDMNPILLKPSSDTGAQVIVQGKVVTELEAEAYHDYKKVAMNAVLDSFSRLEQQYQYVIIEGAGSPAEINLREGDIANMGFAEAVDCPVVIVADIDKGGVFAHLVGTLALLSDSEQQRVVGFIINRFRGERSLLQGGLDWLEHKTGKPVLAVLPYLQDFYLDAEDAVAAEQYLSKEQPPLKVLVPVYSRISNHTDFDALRLHPNIDLHYIGPGASIPAADLIILPGTKNVRADLAWLRQNLWPEALNKHLRYGGKVFGICGGYQMLGQSIADPLGLEQSPGESRGLALIPMTTVLEPQKVLSLGRATMKLGGLEVDLDAYEIHCGRSQFSQMSQSLMQLLERGPEGYISDDGQIAGTYLHGVFDSQSAIDALFAWCGYRALSKPPSLAERREMQLERLAQVIDSELDWSQFANILNL